MLKRNLFVFVMLIGVVSVHAAEKTLFPVPEGMESQVAFWVDVFTRYSNHQTIMHDSRHPERVYRVIDWKQIQPDREMSRDEKSIIIDEEKRKLAATLRKLAAGKTGRGDLTDEEQIVLDSFGPDVRKPDFRQAIYRIRTQGGMREAFRDGLIRSGAYLPAMKAIFREQGLPEALVHIAHVESSFNFRARSAAGAVGVWQFTYPTGQQYLRISSALDERKDPLFSTVAAAKLLKSNYQTLGSWPLAITAYNHGANGISRAVNRTGTRDLAKIVRKYRSDRFGFASRNFYTEFLAACYVADHAEQYFGDIQPESFRPAQYVILPFDMKIKTVEKTYGVSVDTIRMLNPAIHSRFYSGRQAVPRRTRIWLPENRDILGAEKMTLLESETPAGRGGSESMSGSTRLSADEGSSHTAADGQVPFPAEPSLEYVLRDTVILQWNNEALARVTRGTIRVQPEETLGHYADWLNITSWQLRELNKLERGQSIRVGQQLHLDFSRVTPKTFIERRLAYHRALQMAFLENYRIERSEIRVIRSGETLWDVVSDEKTCPLWLLMTMNQGRDMNNMRPGDKVVVPVVRKTG